MPSKKHGLIWPAPPHTVAKIEILRGYLNAYFPIVGSSQRGKPILIVDGFAGPGEYENHPSGSPVIAVETTLQWLDFPRWIAGPVHLAFIEQDEERFSHLQSKLSGIDNSPRLQIHFLNCSFSEGIAQLRLKVRAPFESGSPLFVFIDPFGATGAPFSVVREILCSPCSEVFINLDGDGIARIFRAGERAKSEETLNDIFGDDSWKQELNANDFGVQCRQVRDLYIRKLRQLHRVKYVFPFEMQTKSGALNYFLIFASQHYQGLTKMKEAMKRLDQDGSYCFADDRHTSGQLSIFRFDEPEQYAKQMHKAHFLMDLNYESLRDYALNETPFVNPKSMLAWLEKNELIQVEVKDGKKRRRGTFKEEDIEYIRFV